MADLVFQNSNGNDVTTSLIVAQVFGKEHKNVVRDIENLSCSENFNRLNFERITYKDARNREQTAYEMTKDGFSFLVMGHTGTKAGAVSYTHLTLPTNLRVYVSVVAGPLEKTPKRIQLYN